MAHTRQKGGSTRHPPFCRICYRKKPDTMKKKPNPTFSFQQFTIHQEHCAMKVGTDGVLLGAWATGGSRILDIGTGTALIALMMAQRFSQAHVTAIDIDAEACRQAEENVQASPFALRMQVLCTPLQNMPADGGPLYDSIVSNPPFFIDSLPCPDSRRTAARHATTLPVPQLFAHAVRMLAPQGTLSIIIPTGSVPLFDAEAHLQGLRTARRCDVRTTPAKPPRRTLLAYSRQLQQPPVIEEAVLQNADGSRTEWYAALTRTFYLR